MVFALEGRVSRRPIPMVAFVSFWSVRHALTQTVMTRGYGYLSSTWSTIGEHGAIGALLPVVIRPETKVSTNTMVQ